MLYLYRGNINIYHLVSVTLKTENKFPTVDRYSGNHLVTLENVKGLYSLG